jgi:hypothetical protein
MAVGVNPMVGFDFENHGTDEGHFRALAELSFIEQRRKCPDLRVASAVAKPHWRIYCSSKPQIVV